VLPTLRYGFYPAFLEYPGSVSVSLETQARTVVEIVRSVARHGPRRFYVLNTGVSTVRALRPAAERLAAEGVLLRFTDILEAGREAEEKVREQPRGTHADEMETSMVLYMKPSAVRMEKAVADGLAEASGPLTRDRAKPGGHYSPTGVFGDATLATWQKGQLITEAQVAHILRDIDAVAAAPLPAGTLRSPIE
jgi:creatinine amidohydrolase